jgi:methionine biosynthesis protein MetW
VKVREVLGRGDYALISSLVPEGSRVLDLGCGDGALLEWLRQNKRVEGRGIEVRPELAQRAASRGVAVYQGDLELSLGEYPDGAFDFVILSQTLQELRRPLEVVEQMLRIGRHGIVAFPNFGHWRVRMSHLLSGRSPRTPLFPHAWHSSPNIHFLTVLDFEETAAERGWRIESRMFLSGNKQIRFAPNWRAEIAVYQLRRQAAEGV